MNPWRNIKRYRFFIKGYSVIVNRAKPDAPVRWYTEVHQNKEYRASYGSNKKTELGAVLETFIKYLKDQRQKNG